MPLPSLGFLSGTRAVPPRHQARHCTKPSLGEPGPRAHQVLGLPIPAQVRPSRPNHPDTPRVETTLRCSLAVPGAALPTPRGVRSRSPGSCPARPYLAAPRSLSCRRTAWVLGMGQQDRRSPGVTSARGAGIEAGPVPKCETRASQGGATPLPALPRHPALGKLRGRPNSPRNTWSGT